MIQPDPYELQAQAARIAARSQIVDIRLFETNVKMSQVPPTSDPLVVDFDSTQEVSFNEEDLHFVVEIEYILNIAAQAPADRGGELEQTGQLEPFEEKVDLDIARLQFKFAALFQLQMDDDDELATVDEIQAYAQSTGTFAVHPYAREFVQSMTTRLGLPSLTIPVLTLPRRSPKGD